ncbi:manganese-dependent ADP-ribose/CDP-alcohol diphosphatase-like isoform X2 [Heptranchias perlo]|uniref:manganese-dependent ADP-ribose/CDP-alcohol diphosphatase-like isoform X2 n=1 Tax=Heptranchias perlo TaxID=212740 RepID=UPI003559BC84
MVAAGLWVRCRWWVCGSEIFKRMETEATENNLYFTFGVIADIQYANIENGFNYAGTRERYYRNSLRLLRGAIKEWNEETTAPKFILQLGDIIDGCNSQLKSSDDALQAVIHEFANCMSPVHHIWGNHEFYNFDRELLLKSALNSKHLGNDRTSDNTDSCSIKTNLGPADPEAFYGYHFSPCPKFRFILTDAYDLSILGRKKTSKKHHDSMQILKSNNENENLNSPIGLAGLNLRFVGFNGGFSQEQLEWLNKVLTFSDNNQEKVTVIGVGLRAVPMECDEEVTDASYTALLYLHCKCWAKYLEYGICANIKNKLVTLLNSALCWLQLIFLAFNVLRSQITHLIPVMLPRYN